MADLPSSVTGAPSAAANTPPGNELGAVRQATGFDGWMAFIDEAEYVPQLAFPTSVQTYHKMRSDSQIEALHLGTVQPIREFRWMIDPNKAPKQIVENAATDLGLPIKGEDVESAGIKRVSNKFGFDRFLSDVLLGPLYGFMHFEIVGYIEEAERWRMRKLAPRHPRTIQQFREDDHGELAGIKQIFGPKMATTPPEIPASKLLNFVWRPEAGTVAGRSMLRSMYREWLVKDRVLRSGAINIQRAGGVPVAYAAQGASDKQIEDLAQMARQFKVAEGGGGAFPFGTKLELVGGSVPDAITMLRYCDECMARVWALMLVQLGQTETGSRALGGEFAIYAARAQRLMAKWVAEVVNDFLDRYVEWNEPFADYAPLLCFEPSKPEGLSVTDLVSLLDAGALTVDPELEEWLRAEFNLPDKPEPPEHPDLGELTPDEVALVQNKRNPPVLPDGTPNPDAPQGKPGEKTFVQTPMPKRALDPTVTSPTIARTGTRDLPRLHRGIRASLTLPDRKLRRAPTANEIRAAVDFRALDEAHAATVARLHHDYLNGTLPTQIEHLADQMRAGVKPADLKAPIPERGLERMRGHLSTAAESGVHTAVREAEAQGVVIGAEQRAALLGAARDRAAAQAEHVATMNANGLTLGAQRRAGRLSSRVIGRERAAKDLESHLKGQKHVFERENLKGAATMAQNTGRLAAFEAIAQATAGEGEAATATYEASEILDDATCGPCEAVDGTVYEDLDTAEADYASGGYVDCEGGPNCRGTLVAIYPEQNPVGGEGPLREAEPGYTQPGEDLNGPDELPPPDEPPPEEPPPGPTAEEAPGEGVLFTVGDFAGDTGLAEAAASDAGEAIGSLIDLDRTVPLVPLPNEDTATARLLNRDGDPAIGMHPGTPADSAAVNITHEMGHYVDRYVLGNGSDFSNYGDALYQVMKDSPTMQALRNDEFEVLRGDDRTRNYYLQGREMFARAFQQLVAERSDSEALKGNLAAKQANEHLRLEVWQHDEFVPIRAELERVLDDAGVLRERLPEPVPEAIPPLPAGMPEMDIGMAREIVSNPEHYPDAVVEHAKALVAQAQTTEAEGRPGPLLAKAQTIETHDEAVAFLKDEVGVKEVRFGDKLQRAAEGTYKPGSQGALSQEQARDYIRQLVESVAEAHDTFGEAARIPAIVSNTRAKEIARQLTGRAKGIGNAHAAVRTWSSGRRELIFNDAKSFETMVAKDGHERTGGFVSQATSDPRGIIMHEMGHVLEDGIPGLMREMPRLLADSGIASSAQRRGVAAFISQYATTKTAETWAETFATLMRPGGIDADFSVRPEIADRLGESAKAQLGDVDERTKTALRDFRERLNAWLAEKHPGVPPIPER